MKEVPMDVLHDALELARCVKKTHAHSRPGPGLDTVRATQQGESWDVDSESWVVWAIVIRWSSGCPLISITKQEAPETTDLVGDPVYESAREEEMRRWLEELEEEAETNDLVYDPELTEVIRRAQLRDSAEGAE